MHLVTVKQQNELQWNWLDGHTKTVIPTQELHLLDIAISTACTRGDLILLELEFPSQSQYFFSPEFPAIELMKFLRIIGDRRHIIIYSGIKDAIKIELSDPGNRIIRDQSCTLLKMDATPPDLEELVRKEFDTSLRSFLGSEALPPLQGVHKWTNWWGAKCLWDTHRIVFGGESTQTTTALSKLSNRLQEIKTMVRIVRNAPAILSEWGLCRALSDYVNTMNLAGLTRGEFEMRYGKQWQIPAYLQNRLESTRWQRGTILRKALKVIYIDDEAPHGWADVLQMLLYGKENHLKFKSIYPYSDQSLETFYHSRLVPLIRNHDPDLIILDLRLCEFDDHEKDPTRLSGIRILEWLNGKFKMVPKLAITASNDFHNWEEVDRLGIDAIWIKEGLENSRGPAKSLENYRALVDKIEKLADPILGKLRDFEYKLLRGKNNNHWWEEKTWTYIHKVTKEKVTKITRAEKRDIFRRLQIRLEEFRRIRVLELNLKAMVPAAQIHLLYANLMVSFGGMIEAVHGTSRNITIGGEVEKGHPPSFHTHRGDLLGAHLQVLRNLFAHRNPMITRDFNAEKAHRALNWLFIWLLEDAHLTATFEDIGRFETGDIGWDYFIANIRLILKRSQEHEKDKTHRN